MGKVISFSKSLSMSHVTPHFSETISHEKDHENLWRFFEEEHFLIEAIKEWPCFSSLCSKISSTELLDKYCDNLLSDDQECVLDFLLHLHDTSFVFDLNFSLKSWGKKDRAFFLDFLEKNLKS